MIKTRSTCRVCGNKLEDVLDLGNCNIVAYEGYPGHKPLSRKSPLCLSRCNPMRDEMACGLVQLRHTVPSSMLYPRYYYRSGVNNSMVKHLEDLGRRALDISRANKNDIIVDIGCNDGTSLKWYKEQGYTNLYGFDPARNMAEFSTKTGSKIISDYFNFGTFTKNCKSQAKLISSIAMFYDLENPHDFVNSIQLALDIDGVWVLELAYLPSTLSQNSFDTICHEHLEYYCLFTLERLLNGHNLEIIDVYLNDTNGGSVQVYVSHSGTHQIDDEAFKRIQNIRDAEFDLELDTEKPYTEFKNRVNNNCHELKKFICDAVSNGKTVWAYGASTKGAITLQYCGLDSKLISGCADKNPMKWGTKMAGLGIPIVSEEEARQAYPDYFLILPWHFLSEFKKRENNYLQNGGKFIVPMPQFEIWEQ